MNSKIIYQRLGIADSCPKALVLASKVDGGILVLRSEETRQQIAVRAKKLIEEVGAKLLGIILDNKNTISRDSYINDYEQVSTLFPI